jgi:heme/copper-type cytochrome/quinol oxidase subunit 3
VNSTDREAAPPRVLNVEALPTYAYGNRSLMWWGTLGMILIESTVFIIAIVTYFYLREHSARWPPTGEAPDLWFGTLNTAVLLASAIPNQWTDKVARREDLRGVRIGLVICLLFSAAFLVIRAFELGALNTSWNQSAYGSIVYALMTLHTIHLITDFIDSAVLTALMFAGPLSGKRFVDVSENAIYWWFVVVSWLLIYATVYLAPRLQ